MEPLPWSLEFIIDHQFLISSNCANFSVSSHQIPTVDFVPIRPKGLDPEPDSLKKKDLKRYCVHWGLCMKRPSPPSPIPHILWWL
jgi:hypothetical protein